MTALLLKQKESIANILNNKIPVARKALYILLAIDVLFVLLHLYSLKLPLEESTLNLRLDLDFGYAEMFQYVKYIGSAILLILFFLKRKMRILLIWAFFFLFLFADDAFAFHERFGGQFVRHFEIPGVLGLRAQDIGELAVVGAVAFFFLLSFLYTFFRGAEKSQQITIHYFLLVGILVFFGVFVDMLHSVLVNMPGSGFLTIIEDGGEMLATSLMLWYSLYLFLEQKQPKESYLYPV